MNDGMGEYVATQVIKQMINKGIQIKGSQILIMGITFKEDCPDVRNTKVIDVINALKEYDTNITVYDPWANPEEVKYEYDISIENKIPDRKYDAIVITVVHKAFEKINYSFFAKKNSILYNLKD